MFTNLLNKRIIKLQIKQKFSLTISVTNTQFPRNLSISFSLLRHFPPSHKNLFLSSARESTADIIEYSSPYDQWLPKEHVNFYSHILSHLISIHIIQKPWLKLLHLLMALMLLYLPLKKSKLHMSLPGSYYPPTWFSFLRLVLNSISLSYL